jgi:hypothetical protein
MSDNLASASPTYWLKHQRKHPMPHDQSVRQGDITRVAFQVLGRDRAITFLNTNNALLGCRPIALATESAAGFLHVTGELGRIGGRLSTPA